MEIINRFAEIVDGIVIEVIAYSDGHVERHRKAGQENALTNTERANLEMQSNLEYLVELMEINMEG